MDSPILVGWLVGRLVVSPEVCQLGIGQDDNEDDNNNSNSKWSATSEWSKQQPPTKRDKWKQV